MQGSAFSDEKDRSAEQNRLKQEEGSSAEQDWWKKEEEEENEDEDENVAEKDDFYPAGISDLTREDLTSDDLISECESLWWSHSLILRILSQKQYRGKLLSTVHVHNIGLVGLGHLPFKASSKLFWKANEGRFFLLSSD